MEDTLVTGGSNARCWWTFPWHLRCRGASWFLRLLILFWPFRLQLHDQVCGTCLSSFTWSWWCNWLPWCWLFSLQTWSWRTMWQKSNEDLETFAYVLCAATQDCAHKYVECLGYRPINIIRKTLENTTQLALTVLCFLMRWHIKAQFLWLNCL